MKKFKEIIDNVKSFVAQPIVPTVSMDYVLENDGYYSGNDFMTDKYVYYWVGDFKSGKSVKVKSLDVARYEYDKLKMEGDMYR
jgi:hypothetical protein